MIKINNLSVKYNDIYALDDFSLDINDNLKYGILGNNGSGKTTLFKCILSLIDYEGEILMDNHKISMVFQEDRLIDSLDVFNNLKITTNKSDEEILNILNDLNIINKKDKYPCMLSGGEKRRVSIARAILYDSDVLLLDEAMNNLDIKIKNNILNDIIKYLNNKTLLYITHDIMEAINLCDIIVVISNGKKINELNVSSYKKDELYNIILDLLVNK